MLRLHRGVWVLLLVGLYSTLYVFPPFYQGYYNLDLPRTQIFSSALFDIVTSIPQLLCIVFACTIFRWTWVIFWPLLVLLTAVCDYMTTVYRVSISKDAIAVFFGTTSREFGSFLDSGLLMHLGMATVLAIIGMAFIFYEKFSQQNSKLACLSLIYVSILIVFSGNDIATRYPPYNFLSAAYQYAKERLVLRNMVRRDISETPAVFSAKDKLPLTVVIVIGESARADHLGINGYARDTTPLLRKKRNLLNFPDVSSCGAFTHIALPCILTRATANNIAPNHSETSLISVFRRLGFYTVWLGAQGKFTLSDPTTPISAEAERRVLLEEGKLLDNQVKDEQLLPFLDEALAIPEKPLLVVMHLYGSHWQYSARYPKAFARYTPVCEMTLVRNRGVSVQVEEIKRCDKDRQALINSYDNSILYTDYVLDAVIQKLEQRNALFLYTSDHGESLGEGGRFLHGHADAVENRHVPLLWWASDAFIANNAERWQALQHRKDSRSSHDNLFHSILGCAGVVSSLIEEPLNLCHTEEGK